MKIKQFDDRGLAHFSYAILSECAKEIVLIDPARDPQPYYEYSKEHEAKIIGVIETHPHADFVSSHLEIHNTTGATIYTHSLVGADYPHQAFDEGAVLEFGKIKLKSLHTPGHSPDGISIVLEHEGKDKAVFTGDTLFIGDVGRPDLRESAGIITAKREELARQLYQSTREKLMPLADDVLVYPAHGSGSLCGKSLSDANSSTIGAEKGSNYALKDMSEEEFVQIITSDQPFIPKYFGYDVALNKQGASDYEASIKKVERMQKSYSPADGALVVDTRKESTFKKGHFLGAINIQNEGKFETWLGSIIDPKEQFYLVVESDIELDELITKTAKIGYEALIKGAIVLDEKPAQKSAEIDLEDFRKNPENYTVVDVRNTSEQKQGKFFDHALTIPLPELRDRAQEVPIDKPVVVHCAAGYRSAAGSSILESALPNAKVLDLSDAVNEFKK
ncbi:MAG: MBL fold metallo-hydrolase [Moraxellaceae bacterium]|nr:MAG: MBL fold metallo-hydrolase [Moraxellaceae bacterium]